MITTITTLTDSDLNNVTGGNLSLGERKEGGGGFLSGLSNLWQGTKNQASKTKDAWSSIPNTMGRGFLQSIGLGR
jgi:bacteriocin-like protein